VSQFEHQCGRRFVKLQTNFSAIPARFTRKVSLLLHSGQSRPLLMCLKSMLPTSPVPQPPWLCGMIDPRVRLQRSKASCRARVWQLNALDGQGASNGYLSLLQTHRSFQSRWRLTPGTRRLPRYCTLRPRVLWPAPHSWVCFANTTSPGQTPSIEPASLRRGEHLVRRARSHLFVEKMKLQDSCVLPNSTTRRS
jgi:hypothetical protein